MGTCWQPLPDELPPEVRHFVEQLRLLKDRTGLSLVALGERTAYSKSSWQRYLNAQQPPPRQAVAALCRVAGADGERFGARWELAVRAWPRGAPDARDAAVPDVDAVDAPGGGEEPTVPWWEPLPPEPGTPPPARREPPPWRLLACAAFGLVVVLLVGLILLLGELAGAR
ncbi:helix-turn-helix domain-containing protein [Streptomyces sp. NPDC087300]|uniref:helix-turn-helix domain-containing protein n=1 Tax=Streptomyces sp. NPDC087300 TaxID=3365780 RepID=UPI00380E92F9